MNRLSILGALAILALILGTSVHADEVVLQDGSRIIGTITGLSGGMLSIEGGAAGAVSIPVGKIQTLTTSGEHAVVLNDEPELRGRFATSAGGTIELVTASGPVAINLGQVSEIDPPPADPVKWEGNVNLSAKKTDGNTDTQSVNANAEVVRRAEDNRLTLFGKWAYSEENDTLSARNTTGRGKYDHFINDRLFAYGNVSLEYDKFKDLNLRSTIGAGAGYQFVENETYKFYEEVGVSYFDEDFDSSPDNDFASSRFSGKFDWVITPGRVTFFHFHEVFWSLEDEEDVLVDTRTGFRFTLIADFFASFQVNYTWDNTPASGADRADTEYLLGLGYAFTF